MKISESNFTPKCLECGAEAVIKGKCDNSKVVCPSCKKASDFDEYQDQFEAYIKDSCSFEDEKGE